MLLAIAVIVILGVVLIVNNSNKAKKSNLPPGPWGFPILGHLPLLGSHPGKVLLEWKKKYGPIIFIRFAESPSIVLNDAKLIKEALNLPVFSYRPYMSYFEATDGGRGLIAGSGDDVFEQRRFISKCLHDFGFGSKRLEGVIQTEICELLNQLQMKVGQPMKINNAFSLSTINAFWICIASQRFNYGDPVLNRLAEISKRVFALPSFLAKFSFFAPWVSNLMPNLSGFNEGLHGIQELHAFMKNQIEDQKRSYVKDERRNFIHAYLDQIGSTKDESSSFKEENNILHIILSDLFIAGIETTGTALEWIMIYLTEHREAQSKLQAEISDMVGHDRLPTLNDRQRMPYTEAVIHEVLRRASITPLGGAHCASENIMFHGYSIPKGTMLWCNLYGVFHDPDVWGDPQNFRPERFLDSEGKFRRVDELMPFSVGKRVCLGESLARDQLFLFTTTIFQKFNARCLPGKKMKLEGVFGLTCHPNESNRVVFTTRD